MVLQLYHRSCSRGHHAPWPAPGAAIRPLRPAKLLGITCVRRAWRRQAPALRCLSQPAQSPRRRRAEEEDPNYRRVDLSEQHAYEARRALLLNLAKGEAGLDLADAALQVAAEDDALVSHSVVKLPVASFHKRLERLADEAAELRVRPLVAAGASNEELLAAVQQFVFKDKGFKVTAFGRSALPGLSLVDSPGVWEDARHAYLNEALIRRQGTPAVLMIIVADVLRRLLVQGVIDFTVKTDVSDLGGAPRSHIIPGMGRAAAVRGDGTVLNTLSSEALAELLRFLKRAFWPFPWDAKLGGFVGASEVAVSGHQSSAELEAIARTAAHRLERGIWTSPGAGDLRRAVAAAERLVLLCGERCPKERRDLAVLYLHSGRLAAARVELEYFAARAAKEQEKAPLWQSLHEQILVDKLLDLLRGTPSLSSDLSPGLSPSLPAAAGGSGVRGGSSSTTKSSGGVELLTLESALRQPPPVTDHDARMLPLTW